MEAATLYALHRRLSQWEVQAQRDRHTDRALKWYSALCGILELKWEWRLVFQEGAWQIFKTLPSKE